MNTVEQIRNRMAAGEPIDGDVAWCKQRLRALWDWPEPLTEAQAAEFDQLVKWLEVHG